METVLQSNFGSTLGAAYIFLAMLTAVAFFAVYAMDKQKFLYDRQNTKTYAHRLCFIIQYNDDKRVVDRLTLRLELLTYAFALILVGMFTLSLFLTVRVAIRILIVMAVAVFVWAGWMSVLYRKQKDNHY